MANQAQIYCCFGGLRVFSRLLAGAGRSTFSTPVVLYRTGSLFSFFLGWNYVASCCLLVRVLSRRDRHCCYWVSQSTELRYRKVQTMITARHRNKQYFYLDLYFH